MEEAGEGGEGEGEGGGGEDGGGGEGGERRGRGGWNMPERRCRKASWRTGLPPLLTLRLPQRRLMDRGHLYSCALLARLNSQSLASASQPALRPAPPPS